MEQIRPLKVGILEYAPTSLHHAHTPLCGLMCHTLRLYNKGQILAPVIGILSLQCAKYGIVGYVLCPSAPRLACSGSATVFGWCMVIICFMKAM